MPTLIHEDLGALLPTKWMKRENGFVKINVGYAVFPVNNTYGIGIIERNSYGVFIATQSQQHSGVLNPFEEELLAARDGLWLACNLGLDNIELEGDSITVWRTIRDGEVLRSYTTGNIMIDILSYSPMFRCFKCSFTPRNCNRATDVLTTSLLWCRLKIIFLICTMKI